MLSSKKSIASYIEKVGMCWYNYYESRKCKPDNEMLLLIADKLNVDVNFY